MFEVKGVGTEGKMRLVNASGGKIEHIGRREVWFNAVAQSGFLVAGVRMTGVHRKGKKYRRQSWRVL